MPSAPSAVMPALADASSPEDADRAKVWNVLARLYIAPPDAVLLRHLAGGVEVQARSGEPSALQAAWDALANKAGLVSQETAREEFETLFGGIGRPSVYVYGSYYLAGALHEKPLARLRSDLQTLGLTRRQDVGESEDHFAILAEIMWFLSTGNIPGRQDLAHQRELFQRHIEPWALRMCDAIVDHPAADFYRKVAEFTRAFLVVEQVGFDLLD
ncbi:molecular chaperone [Thiomonas sp. FB-Cd]|uniref:TorD/DmsD family molecular chaperone n=1 Tax=Thiomonas sp. FB-Cd TaxID=1158292 RepID=UPI00068985F0|nr:molecular chaperone TorD family protein [Thiomonas sp. FB-Cd]